MNRTSITTTASSDERIEELRENLSLALDLMDEIQPSSIPAARLQQIIDELDVSFGSKGSPQP